MRTYQARPKSKYADPRWQRKRLEVMQRDGFACICCKEDKETLNVHHSYYVAGRDLWEYPTTTLFTLCHKCHKEHSEDPIGFIEKSNTNLGWWEVELEYATRIMIEAGVEDFGSIDVYVSLFSNRAVCVDGVSPARVCRALSKAIVHLLSEEWLTKLEAEANDAEARLNAELEGIQ